MEEIAIPRKSHFEPEVLARLRLVATQSEIDAINVAYDDLVQAAEGLYPLTEIMSAERFADMARLIFRLRSNGMPVRVKDVIGQCYEITQDAIQLYQIGLGLPKFRRTPGELL